MPIAGKPLIDWSLDQLINFPKVDHFIVSTDDERIYEHAVKKGALDVGLRPSHLSTDASAKWDVWRHSLDAAERELGTISAFLDLDCTSPLRLELDIAGALSLFWSEKPDLVMSCCEARKNPYFNLVEPDKNGFLRVSKSMGDNVVARQQAPVVYEHAASTYVVSPDYLKTAESLYEGRVLPYLMPAERCFDIDSPLDFRIVEFFLREYL